MLIHSRAAWGARYDDGFGPAPLPATELWLHHSVTSAPPVAATFEQDAAAVRVLEQIGENRFGMGISYTFVVAPSGRAFVGHSVGRQGAHTGGRNSIARAICLIGNYEVAVPSDAMVAAVAELVAVGAACGWWDRPALDGGHRDVPGASTACPGRNAHRLIPQINSYALEGNVALTEQDLNAVRDRVWGALIPDYYAGNGTNLPAFSALGWGGTHAARSSDGVTALRAEVAAVKAAVDSIEVGGIDYELLADKVADRLAERMAD